MGLESTLNFLSTPIIASAAALGIAAGSPHCIFLASKLSSESCHLESDGFGGDNADHSAISVDDELICGQVVGSSYDCYPTGVRNLAEDDHNACACLLPCLRRRAGDSSYSYVQERVRARSRHREADGRSVRSECELKPFHTESAGPTGGPQITDTRTYERPSKPTEPQPKPTEPPPKQTEPPPKPTERQLRETERLLKETKGGGEDVATKTAPKKPTVKKERNRRTFNTDSYTCDYFLPTPQGFARSIGVTKSSNHSGARSEQPQSRLPKHSDSKHSDTSGSISQNVSSKTRLSVTGSPRPTLKLDTHRKRRRGIMNHDKLPITPKSMEFWGVSPSS